VQRAAAPAPAKEVASPAGDEISRTRSRISILMRRASERVCLPMAQQLLRQGRQDVGGELVWRTVAHGALPRVAPQQEFVAMNVLLKLAENMRRALEVVALASGWLLVIMACVTTFDVVARKLGLQLPYTKLQELEWHFHAAIFSLWMGYCYTINAHPRVDTFTEMMSYRRRAWIELAGCLLLALPYMALVAYYSLDFVAQSYRLGEQSDSTVGLTHRWIIKGIYAAGLWMVVLGILSVLLRVIVFLFGEKSEREVNLQIGHVITDV
jgi:TRAP-type mannitol/chloroaromatic compound transport system permease small subunit